MPTFQSFTPTRRRSTTRRQLLRGAAALLAAAATSLTLLAPVAAADPITPPDPTLGFSRWLPPIPVPYYPSTETACASGADSCIDATIATMQARLDRLATTCDHDAVFGLAYLRVTEAVRDAVDAGEYADARWINHQDAVFAEDYFNAYDAWHAGRRSAVPSAWRIAFQAADDRRMSALGNFLLAMNAHINRDFPYVLAGIGLTAQGGRSHKPDHDRFNRRLGQLYVPVLREVAARFDPTADDLDVGPIDDVAAAALLETWREVVWRHAEALALTTNEWWLRPWRPVVVASIENYATDQALIFRTLLATPSSTARDAYCAVHGRG